jgi:predicted GIY-YIG superfamily endonuclease
MFTCLKTGEYYFGSALDLYIRYKQHKTNSIRPIRGGNNLLYKKVRSLG